MKLVFLRKGQNLVDLALLIMLVGIVVTSMGLYIRRSMQGKVKDMTDYVLTSGQAPDEEGKNRRAVSSLDSTMTMKELSGGGKSLIGSERSNYKYEPTD
ncbi:MAG: hypothetical protein PHS66_06670 [Candidatus Omnitrophica bacterium]|nr:hypothetical protein [Candidatus Omnitrophota bacterium]